MKLVGASKPASFRPPVKQGYRFKMKRTFGDGGEVESKEMVQKEIDFFKKHNAPKSMITHEVAEKNALRKGGKVRGTGAARKGLGRGRMV
jgi:hypothetical protein